MSIVPELLDLATRLEGAPRISLDLHFARGRTGLDVRHYEVSEALSMPFVVDIEAVSEDHDLDLSTLVGLGAGFSISSTLAGTTQIRLWEGICTEAELVKTPAASSIAAAARWASENPLVMAAAGGGENLSVSTYRLRIEHAIARLRYRTDNRIFQGLTIPQIVCKVLERWHFAPVQRLTLDYPVVEYCVQYAETDFAFVSRLLEEAGITYTFEKTVGAEIILTDAPQAVEPRTPVIFDEEISKRADVDHEFVGEVRIVEQMRPTRYALRGSDFLVKADDRLDGLSVDERAEERGTYESYCYDPHAFRAQSQAHDDSAGDELGTRGSRAITDFGTRNSKIRLLSQRRGVKKVLARTNSLDLGAGTVFNIDNHPRAELAQRPVVVTRLEMEGGRHDLSAHIEAVFTDDQLVPERKTPKPTIRVQSAVVVGPADEEIHVDVHGRVKVQFHWDRDGMFDDKSSCWIRVSQAVAGSAQGMIAHCRVGQEVLVDFFDGDPDQPIVVGRVFNAVNPAPLSLPKHKAWTGIKTDTYPRSDGFNQLMFKDDRDDECIHLQAQRNYHEIIKKNQSSEVGTLRSSHVGSTDLLVVGDTRSIDVGNQSFERVGIEKQTHVGKTRISTIGEHDYIEAGESFTVTTGAGTGIQISGSSKRIALTNGQASIVIDGPNVFIDAQNGIQLTGKGVVRADSVSGNVEINCGATGAFGKPAGAEVAVCTIPEAEVPHDPSPPAIGGATSAPPYRYKPELQPFAPPVPFSKIRLGPGPVSDGQ